MSTSIGFGRGALSPEVVRVLRRRERCVFLLEAATWAYAATLVVAWGLS